MGDISNYAALSNERLAEIMETLGNGQEMEHRGVLILEAARRLRRQHDPAGIRHINTPTVFVQRVDGSDTYPDLLWFVKLINEGGRGIGSTVLGQFEEGVDAVEFATDVANRNGWSLRLAAERKKV